MERNLNGACRGKKPEEPITGAFSRSRNLNRRSAIPDTEHAPHHEEKRRSLHQGPGDAALAVRVPRAVEKPSEKREVICGAGGQRAFPVLQPELPLF